MSEEFAAPPAPAKPAARSRLASTQVRGGINRTEEAMKEEKFDAPAKLEYTPTAKETIPERVTTREMLEQNQARRQDHPQKATPAPESPEPDDREAA